MTLSGTAHEFPVSTDLGDAGQDDFERNARDVFERDMLDMGELKGITVDSDQSHPDGVSGDARWCIDWITVQNVKTGRTWFFPIYYGLRLT